MTTFGLPDSCLFENKSVPLYTFEQLSQQPRQKLKNRAMDLRDLVGADRLTPLRSSGSVELVTMWILETQCAIAKSAGIDLSPAMLGLPANYGDCEDGTLMQPGAKAYSGAPQRAPMQELQQGAGADAMAAYDAAMSAAAATKLRNQQGSGIFG